MGLKRTDEWGRKEIIGLADGYRESTQSWRELLLDLQRCGLAHAPDLVVGDGALGFWNALREVFGATKEQRYWFHKTGNVLNAMPKSVQAKAKGRRLTYPNLPKGAWLLLVPTGQLGAAFGANRLERAIDDLPSPADRVAHLFGLDLPGVLTVALSSPAQSVMDVLTGGKGLATLILPPVAVLAAPLWAIPANQRATVAGLCEYP